MTQSPSLPSASPVSPNPHDESPSGDDDLRRPARHPPNPVRLVSCLFNPSSFFTPRIGLVCIVTTLALAFMPNPSPGANAPKDGGEKPDVDSKYGKTCISSGCHPVNLFGLEIKHAPYLEGACLQCHLDHASSAPGLMRRTGYNLCLPCHTTVEMKPGRDGLVHPPTDKDCTVCHNPHESRVRNLLRNEDLLKECAKCHADFLAKAKQRPYQHRFFEPVTECGSCHYAHHGRQDKYLRKNLTQSCLTCHDIPIRVDGRTLPNIGEEILNDKVVHGAMKQAGCGTCHNPHGAEQPALLRKGYPAGKYQPYKRADYDLCWQCHKPALVESVNGTGVTLFRRGTENLHRVHVVQLKQGRACHICHRAHASNTPHLLRTEIRFGKWQAPLEYKVLPDGGSCVTPCHQKKEYHRSTAPVEKVIKATPTP